MIRIFSFSERPHIECFKHYRKSLNRVANFSILRNKYAASTASAYVAADSHNAIHIYFFYDLAIGSTVVRCAMSNLNRTRYSSE